MIKQLLASLALALVLPAASAQSVARMTGVTDYYQHRDGFMGTVVVAKDGRILFERSYGYANIEWQLPFTPDTRFPIGSLSKQFTAAAILLLQQDGKLKTSDPIAHYYKNAPPAWANITLRNLLTHTSGIPEVSAAVVAVPARGENSSTYTYSPHTPQEMVQWTLTRPLTAPPGTAYNYSNTNYVLLSLVIEAVSGESYCAFMKQRLFLPLGLTHTGCGWSSQLIPHRVYAYRPSGKTFVRADEDDLTYLAGAANLYSTANDLVRWAALLNTGKVLSPASFTEMTTPFLDSYAYGLGVQDLGNGVTRISHNGKVYGVYSALDYLPQTRTTIVVLSNVLTEGNAYSPGANAIENELMQLAVDKTSILPSEGKEISLPESTLSRYVGQYKAQDISNDEHKPASFRIFLKQGHLYMDRAMDGDAGREATGHAPSQSPSLLHAESPTDFYLADEETEVDFDPKGAAVVIDDNGQSATTFVRN